MTRLLPLVSALLLVAFPPAHAETFEGGPDDYRELAGRLGPGDVLELAPGDYPEGLDVTGLEGTARDWIVIRGHAQGRPARFLGDPDQGRNTVEIRSSCYVAIEHVTIDGQDVPGVFAVSAKDGRANSTHHIRIEDCAIVGYGSGQQTVGISTKCPTWGWVIRGNRITGAGTGMYLGNSDGADPFVGGLIEYNLIEDTVGYNLQVKHQNDWEGIPELPQDERDTRIRHNVFVKNDAPSPDGDRPNVLVGTLPPEGPGADAMVHIYGNLFLHNPRENLLQVTGRVSIHDNLFVDAAGAAIRLADHNGNLDLAHVYHNTIVATGTGICFAADPDTGYAVLGNLVFAETPIEAEGIDIPKSAGNVLGRTRDASRYLRKPSLSLGAFDLSPRKGACIGEALDLSPFAGEPDFDRDFEGNSKAPFRVRGAYAADGGSPAWKPAREQKPAIAGR